VNQEEEAEVMESETKDISSESDEKPQNIEPDRDEHEEEGEVKSASAEDDESLTEPYEDWNSEETLEPNDTEENYENEDLEDKEAKEPDSEGIKSNIKRIISQEKTKQLIDELKQLDLSAFCDLNQMDTKECLKKILDETSE
jgi:hypothetical protein